jgi:hypothetical protein
MNGNILSSVALLMGELCVVWSGWANFFCWVSINCERWLMFKTATKFLQSKEANFFVVVVGFWFWF